MRGVAETDRRLANLVRIGRVSSVDPGNATAVVSLGDLETPSLPVSQLRAGALQFWWMPTAGEQVLIACPSGDIAQGVIVCSIFAGNAPSADGDVPQINLSGGKMIVNGDIEVTGDVIASGVSLVNHIHKDVTPGAGKTGEPVK